MPNLITLKIDVKKLDKSRFFQGKPNKDGHAPLYCDLVLIALKETGKYGDTHIVKQSKEKDEKVELRIIGNATERGAPAYQAPQDSNNSSFHGNTVQPPAQTVDDMDVPF
jgi:hypothetical protein